MRLSFFMRIRQNFYLMGRKQEVEKLATILILRDGQNLFCSISEKASSPST